MDFRITDRKAPRREVDRYVRTLANSIMSDARSATPVRTGQLRNAWRTVRSGEFARYRVLNDTEYARFVEYGTRHMAPAAMLGQAVARHRSG